MNSGLNTLNIVAFTHRNSSLSEVGELHIDPEHQEDRLLQLKNELGIDELMFLSTCNRVEFIICDKSPVNEDYMAKFLSALYPKFDETATASLAEKGAYYCGTGGVEHMLNVASSVDSMVVGEREIITQVRKAFESSRKMNLSGDLIRLVIRHTIETAKKVYTETNIAKRPVSVVSLAYHKLRDLNVALDARILIIGAGITNTNMSRFLRKHGFTNFHVFNRTLSKAEKLANDLNGTALNLDQLSSFEKGFDIIITCTGAEHHIITPEIYHSLLNKETDKKYVVDLAIPQDLSPEIVESNTLSHISIEMLQKISNENLKARSMELQHVEEILQEALFDFEHIYQLRSVEVAMREVPNKVKEIKDNALNNVFKNELSTIDDESREVLEQIVEYMEKKYMSVPMVMAKEILLKQQP